MGILSALKLRSAGQADRVGAESSIALDAARVATTRIFEVTFVIARDVCRCAATFVIARRLAYNDNTMTTVSSDDAT
jgi:hypothetical protein